MSLESRMRSGTRRGVSKWSIRKDRDIGRLYSEIGKVPSDSGIYRSTGELREFAGEKYWDLLGHTGIEERGQKEGGVRPPPLVRIGQGVQPPFPSSSPPLSFSPTPTRKGGVLLPVGVGSRTPPLVRLLLGRPPPPLLLYIRGQGAPHRHNN